MKYHKVNKADCLSVATNDEGVRLNQILDTALMKHLAKRWCDNSRYKLGGYLGSDKWDATK